MALLSLMAQPAAISGTLSRVRPVGTVRANDVVVDAAKVRQLEERIRDLERLLGRKTLEIPPSPSRRSEAEACRGRQRPHRGEVATSASNQRWAADVSRSRAGAAMRCPCRRSARESPTSGVGSVRLALPRTGRRTGAGGTASVPPDLAGAAYALLDRVGVEALQRTASGTRNACSGRWHRRSRR